MTTTLASIIRDIQENNVFIEKRFYNNDPEDQNMSIDSESEDCKEDNNQIQQLACSICRVKRHMDSFSAKNQNELVDSKRYCLNHTSAGAFQTRNVDWIKNINGGSFYKRPITIIKNDFVEETESDSESESNESFVVNSDTVDTVDTENESYVESELNYSESDIDSDYSDSIFENEEYEEYEKHEKHRQQNGYIIADDTVMSDTGSINLELSRGMKRMRVCVDSDSDPDSE